MLFGHHLFSAKLPAVYRDIIGVFYFLTHAAVVMALLIPLICEQWTKCPFTTFRHFPAPLTSSSIVIWPWHLLALVIIERSPDDQSQFYICSFCKVAFITAHSCSWFNDKSWKEIQLKSEESTMQPERLTDTEDQIWFVFLNSECQCDQIRSHDHIKTEIRF